VSGISMVLFGLYFFVTILLTQVLGGFERWIRYCLLPREVKEAGRERAGCMVFLG